MKIISGQAPRGGGGPSVKLTPQQRVARKAAIEASQTKYIKLVCTHYTTLERDEAYSYWRPRKGVTWCENCGGWKKFQPKPKRDIIPPEPLF